MKGLLHIFYSIFAYFLIINTIQAQIYNLRYTALKDISLFSSIGFPTQSVDNTNGIVIIGNPNDATDINNMNYRSHAGAAYIYEVLPDGSYHETKVTPMNSDRVDNQLFGWGVAVDGNNAIVSSYDFYGIPSQIWVFERLSLGNWQQIQKISPSISNINFGIDVSLSGNYLIVGASSFTISGDTGKAVIFEKIGSSWQEKQIITPSLGNPDDYFGNSVAIDSNGIAVIGSHGNSNHYLNAGIAYTFIRDINGNWVESDILTASSNQINYRFGVSVDISFPNIIVGSDYAINSQGITSGIAYVYHYDNFPIPGWQQSQILEATNGQSFDAFGTSVSISDTTIAIGAKEANGGLGAVYVYNYNSNLWSEVDIINPPTYSNPIVHNYAFSVSNHNHTIAIGAEIFNSPQDVYIGYIHKFCLPFDINCDGCVNTQDLVILLNAYPSQIGDPNYNLTADINQDNFINILDVNLLVSNFGCDDVSSNANSRANNVKLPELLNSEQSIKLFPNPTNNLTNISLNFDEISNYQLELYNLNGQLINQFQLIDNANQYFLNVSDHPKGLYLIRVYNDSSSFTKWLLKH